MSNQKIAGLLMPMATSKVVFREFAQYIKEAHPENAVHLTALLKYVWKKRTEDTDEIFDKKNISELIFPNEEYKIWKIEKIYAKTVKFAEKFLLERALEKREHLRNLLLAESLKELNLENQALRKIEKNLENLPKEEEERFEVSEKANKLIYFKMTSNLKEKKKKRQHLINAFRDNQIRYIIAGLKYCCEFQVRKLLWGEPYEDGTEEKINTILANIEFREFVPLIDIQGDLALLFQAPTVEKYIALKTKFLNADDLLHSEKSDILVYLINAVSLVKVNDRLLEYFELYKHGVEKGYFLANNEISGTNFNNIIYAACESMEIEWAENFMSNNFQYLSKPTELLDNIKVLYECFFLFAKKDFHPIIEKLDNLYFEDYTYGLFKHSFLLKCTYEIHKQYCMDEMLRIMDSFRAFLNKKVQQKFISREFKLRYFNSMLVLKKLIEYPYDKKLSQKGISDYYESFEGKTVYDKWLREKISLLK